MHPESGALDSRLRGNDGVATSRILPKSPFRSPTARPAIHRPAAACRVHAGNRRALPLPFLQRAGPSACRAAAVRWPCRPGCAAACSMGRARSAAAPAAGSPAPVARPAAPQWQEAPRLARPIRERVTRGPALRCRAAAGRARPVHRWPDPRVAAQSLDRARQGRERARRQLARVGRAEPAPAPGQPPVARVRVRVRESELATDRARVQAWEPEPVRVQERAQAQGPAPERVQERGPELAMGQEQEPERAPAPAREPAPALAAAQAPPPPAQA
jgi:hypothetical protein